MANEYWFQLKEYFRNLNRFTPRYTTSKYAKWVWEATAQLLEMAARARMAGDPGHRTFQRYATIKNDGIGTVIVAIWQSQYGDSCVENFLKTMNHCL